MRPAASPPKELERLAMLCLVMAPAAVHLRLLDAVLRSDVKATSARIDNISSNSARDGQFYPLLMQVVLDHAHPDILDVFQSHGHATSDLEHAFVSLRGPGGATLFRTRAPNADDALAWRLSTSRCIELVDHEILPLKNGMFEQLLMLADEHGFDRLLEAASTARPQAPILDQGPDPTADPWRLAHTQTSMAGAWMATWRLETWRTDMLASLHPMIQAASGKMSNRWDRCVDVLLDRLYPQTADPSSRLQALLSDPERVRVDLGLEDHARLGVLTGIVNRAMDLANAKPCEIQQVVVPVDRQVFKHDWMHALVSCGFKPAQLSIDPLCELLHDAAAVLKPLGSRARFSSQFLALYGRLIQDMAINAPERIANLPAPFLDEPLVADHPPVVGWINQAIASMSDEHARSLADSLLMHAGTGPVRANPPAPRRM